MCSRQLSSGKSKYQIKCLERLAIYESKKIRCKCKIVIKIYPHTPTILGRYEEEHDHEVGIANIKHMRMSPAARLQIKSMLVMKIDPREIVHQHTIGH
jgi:hypothetical protein